MIANSPKIDEIYAHMHLVIEDALEDLNRNVGWVSDAQASRNPPKATPGGENGGLRDETANPPYNGILKEWQVPFDFPAGWPEAARKPFDAFHATHQAMQKKLAISKNKLRITGPFTVETVLFATLLGLDEVEQPKQADVAAACCLRTV